MADETAGGALPPAKHGVPLPVLIGVVLGVALLVGGGTVAAVYFLRPPAAAAEDEPLAEAEHGLEPEHEEPGAFLTIEEPFIVNLKPDPAFPYSYLKFAVALEVADAHFAETLSTDMPKIQATINGMMNNVPYADLTTEAGQKEYTNRITAELNRALAAHAHAEKEGEEPHPPVRHVYFTTLVAQ